MVQKESLSPEVVYVVMPEGAERELVMQALSRDAFSILTAPDVDAFAAVLDPAAVGCVVAPVDLADDGIHIILATLRARGACLALCALGREHDFPAAVDLIKRGASEFVEQPLTKARILAAVRRAVAASHNACARPPCAGASESG